MNIFERYLPFYGPDEGGSSGASEAAPSGSGGEASGGDTSVATAGEASEALDSEGFSDLSKEFTIPDGDDLDEVEVQLPAGPTEGEPDAKAAPKVDPKAPPAKAAEPAKDPKAAPDAKAKPPAEEAPQPEPAKAAESGGEKSLVEQVGERKAELIDALANDRFKLTKEEADALELDVIGNVPKLLSKVYYESVVTTLHHIQQQVPRLVHEYMQRTKAHDQVLDGFFGQFKALDRTKHLADANTFARNFRAVNPQITQEELNLLVGSAVMAKYGLTGQPAAHAPGQNGAAPKPAPVQPFVPARPGAGGTAAQVSVEPENEFAGLAKEYED